MSENYKKVIARAIKKTGDKGFIIPVYSINGNSEIEKVGDEERRKEKFSNKGTVIIHKGFYDISESYLRNELFLIGYEESNSFDERNPNSCKYQSLGGDTYSLEKLPLLIKSSFLSIGDEIRLKYSGHKYIFIEDGEYIYGPYSIEEENATFSEKNQFSNVDFADEDYFDDKAEDFEYVYNIKELYTYDLGIDDQFQNVILKFSKQSLESFIVPNIFRESRDSQEYQKENYIYNIRDIFNKITPIDYILEESDDDIIRWAEKSFPKNYTAEKINSWLSSNDANNPIHRKRFDRFISIKEKSASWVSFIDSYISNKYINTPEGQTKINQFVENNKQTLLKSIEEELRIEARKKVEILETEIDILLSEKNEHVKAVNLLKVEKEQLLNESELIKAKSEQLQKLELDVKNKEESLNVLNGIDDAKQEYDKWQDYLSKIRGDIKVKEGELRKLQTETQEELKKKVENLYPVVRAIMDTPKNGENHDKKISYDLSINRYSKEEFDILRYAQEAKQFLSSNNRNFNDVEIINLLTCLNQNFLTIFTGLPGVGKTSLANLLSNFVCSNDFSLEIPVGRGWNSKKNLLGFYNPLKGEYQPDEYGFIERIKLCNESNQLLDNVSFIITLDEANLSPIEHYWSDFIILNDKKENKSIKIVDGNGNQELKLPQGFKFIFTINHDHTTELLSPRLLDRACVIKLQYDPVSINSNQIFNKKNELDGFYSYNIIKEFFVPDKYELILSERKVFEDIINIIGDKSPKLGKQVPISPRKIKAISQYCHVVRKPYNDLGAPQYLALDYAILHNVLPLINGQGSGFEARLGKLREELLNKSLKHSAQEVEDIINKGKDFQYYSYL